MPCLNNQFGREFHNKLHQVQGEEWNRSLVLCHQHPTGDAEATEFHSAGRCECPRSATRLGCAGEGRTSARGGPQRGALAAGTTGTVGLQVRAQGNDMPLHVHPGPESMQMRRPVNLHFQNIAKSRMSLWTGEVRGKFDNCVIYANRLLIWIILTVLNRLKLNYLNE